MCEEIESVVKVYDDVLDDCECVFVNLDVVMDESECMYRVEAEV